jgi:hypothetical protein
MSPVYPEKVVSRIAGKASGPLDVQRRAAAGSMGDVLCDISQNMNWIETALCDHSIFVAASVSSFGNGVLSDLAFPFGAEVGL